MVPGMPPGSATRSYAAASTPASARSGVTVMPCEPVIGPDSVPATSTVMPARRSTSTIVIASISSKPGASGTSTRFTEARPAGSTDGAG